MSRALAISMSEKLELDRRAAGSQPLLLDPGIQRFVLHADSERNSSLLIFMVPPPRGGCRSSRFPSLRRMLQALGSARWEVSP